MPKSNVVELDFDLIKDDLKEHLRGNAVFKDFDFEGAGINLILDVLAKSDHFVAYMANMMGNEMFIDSADIRQSVVSKAKELGYIPRSARASKATINLILKSVQDVVPAGGGPAAQPAYVEIAPGTQFTTSTGLIFSTNDTHLLYPTGVYGEYRKDGIDIYDGRLIDFEYVVDSGIPDQKFIIPDVDADTSTLSVVVKPSTVSTEKTVYRLNDDVNYLTSGSTVYFLHETPEGYFEVTFGDGILGKKVSNGNVVILSYIIASEKGDANGIDTFLPYQRINGQGSDDIEIITDTRSYNGDEKETIESIKFHALRFFQSQRRAVTTKDYEAFLISEYPFIESINTWGGEYNDPPVYGKIFIAIKPKHTTFLSTTLKEQIKEHLIKKYNVVTVIPEMVDPEYTYINVESVVSYTKSKTTLTEASLIELVMESIYNYFLATTRKFKMNFQFSPMVRTIDATNSSIDNSLTEIYMNKRVYPIVGMTQTFTVKFANGLKSGSVFSSYFNTESDEVTGKSIKTGLQDDGKGVIYSFNADTGIVINPKAGVVDYVNGIVTFTIHTYGLPLDTMDLRVYATPASKNIIPGNNQIIVPDTSAMNGVYNRKQGISVSMKMTNVEVS